MKERPILRVKYLSANKPLRILRRGKKKTIDFYKSLKYVFISLVAFFKGEPIRNYPKFHFSLMRLRSATILALIGLMLASFLSFAGGGIFAGVSNSWVVTPDTQLATATVSDLQSTGYGAVELEKFYNKTLDDKRLGNDRSTDRQMNPIVAVDGSGNMYVSFTVIGSNIRMQKVSNTGTILWDLDKTVFTSCNTGVPDSDHDIAMMGNDAIVVASCSSGGNYQILAQRIDSSGNRVWGSDVRVNDNTGSNKTMPQVAVVGSEIFVVWKDARVSAADADVYAQKLDSNGTRQIVGDHLIYHTAAHQVSEPRIKSTSTNKLIIAYHYAVGSTTEPLYAIQTDTSFIIEWGPSLVGHVESNGYYMTVMGENSYFFWRGWWYYWPMGWGNYVVFPQSLDNTGTWRWEDEEAKLQSHYPGLVEPGPPIYAWNDGTNPYYVVAEFTGHLHPFGRKMLEATGNTAWGDEQAMTQSMDGSPASVVYNNGYNWIFGTKNNAVTFEDIMMNRFNTNGTIDYAQDVIINRDYGVSDQISPAIVKDGAGKIFAAWRDYRGGAFTSYIYANLYDSSGVAQWANDTKVNSAGFQATPPKVFNVGTDYYVLWTDNDNVFMNKLNSAGVRQWADLRVNAGGGNESSNPSFAYDGTNLAVVWEDNRTMTGNTEIYFNAVSTAGVRQLVADQKVNIETTGSQKVPVIVSDAVNTYIVWQDYRNPTRDIYMQKVNGSGVPQYVADVRIDDSGAALVEHYSPDALINGGNLYIVWADTRDSLAARQNIYMVGFNGDTRLWSDKRISEDIESHKYSPRISYSSAGFYIVWEDDRNDATYHDIYINRADTSGVKEYGHDTRINDSASSVHHRSPSITPNDRFIAWDDDRNSLTLGYDVFLAYGSDQYMPSGTILGTGMILDTGTVNVRCQTISWTDTVPANTTVRFRSRTATTLGGLPAAAWSAYYTVSGENITSSDLQFMEIELLLDTIDTTTTPTVTNFAVAYLTNEAPVVNNITIQSTDNRQVQFSYNLNDVDDPTAVITFEYLYGGTWHASSHVTNLGLKSVGSSYNSVWDSTFDIPPTEVVTTQIRLTADDQYSFNNLGSGLSLPFLLDYNPPPPSPSISSRPPPSITRRPPSPSFTSPPPVTPIPSFSYHPTPSSSGNPPPPGPWNDIINFFTSLAQNRLIPFSAWLIALILITTFWRYNPYVWLGRRRKKRKWGIVFDEGTKQPVAGAIINIIEAETKQTKQTIICNENGEFDLLLPAGKFYLNVRSPNVVQIKEGPFGRDGGSFTTGREDLYYKNLYFAKEIVDTSSLEKKESQEVQLSIPVITKGISESKKKMHQAWENILDVLEYLRLPLLIIGTFLALILLIARGNIADIIIFIVYLLIWAWDIYVMLSTDTAVVYVYDASSFKPLSLVVLRLIKEKNQAIIDVETTNRDGKAIFRTIENGIYKIQAAKADYEVYRTEAQSIQTLKALGRIKIGLKAKR